jgi:hypothetical protein
MLRILNVAFVAITATLCVGLYRVAEEARVTQEELRTTLAAVAQENDDLVVLGAEWARLTQPARIQALASRHLKLADDPSLQLSSVTSLPSRSMPVVPDNAIRAAKAVQPAPMQQAHIGYPGT